MSVEFHKPMEPEAVALQLLDYCRSNDWAGFDPYDALNSRLFQALPFLNTRLPRLVMTQALKRSPINLRPLLQIPKTQNSKGLALFLGSLLKLSRACLLKDESLIQSLADKILELRSPNTDLWCWGYSFPWQTRTIVVPRGSPNVVCTIFVASALLDLYERTRDAKYLKIGVSAAEFILQLIWREGNKVSLSYPLATLKSEIHNANLLGAAFLGRVSRLSGEQKFMPTALELARYAVSKQREDGSWPYGELPTQQWIDNFHTGYNLSGLRSLGVDADTNEFDSSVRRGFEFYRTHFFRDDGAAKYFHNETYPIDVHCVAQSILTLLEFKELHPDNVALATRVFDWAVANMWDSSGFFYYRVLPFCKIRTSYMRWSQAWMLISVSALVEERRSRPVASARQDAVTQLAGRAA